MTAPDAPAGTRRTGDFRAFVSAVARNPGTVGAVAPSSAGLADCLAGIVPSTGTPTVVELGPGTGSVSAAVDRRLPPGGRHLAVEIDPILAERLRSRRPGLEVINGDAAELTALLAARGVDSVDAVVCGLPWSLFAPEAQQAIMSQIGEVLAPGAAFTTFAYLHAKALGGARRFRRLLEASFDEVITTRAVWRNLPPALVYVCRRPRSGAER